MPGKRKAPAKLGTVWPVSATIMNSRGYVIARCIDTPNAIAKALLKTPRGAKVRSILGTHSRDYYKSRMQPWNKVDSGLVLVRNKR